MDITAPIRIETGDKPDTMPTGCGVILRENVERESIKHLELRQQFWSQVHPRGGRFRQRPYRNSTPWAAVSETFVEQTGSDDFKPNHLDWVRGTYRVDVPVTDGLCEDDIIEVQVRLTVSLDFTKDREECIHWTIDLTGVHVSDADSSSPDEGKEENNKHAHEVAYPGIHSGFFVLWNASSFNTHAEVFWETPIFSPYVSMERPWRGNDKSTFKPTSMKSTPESRGGESLTEAGHVEALYFGNRKVHASVLQEMLKDIARLLVFGPSYENMQLPPIAPYKVVEAGFRADETSEFYESEHFAAAASFFSRAFCWSHQKLAANGRCNNDTASNESSIASSLVDLDQQAVSPEQCQKTVETAEAILEHFQIVAEPPWLSPACDETDWLDDLQTEAAALKTVGEWRRFERKWALITSYACGLILHEGPWAGEDWACYVD